MKTLFKYFLFVLFLVGISCQDPITLDLETAETRIVISGRVTDLKGTFARVSTTAPYLAQGNTPKVDGATVTLLENGIPVDTLQRDSLPGIYTSTYNGSWGNTYNIQVDIGPNNPAFPESSWQSKPELMKRVFTIDSTTLKYLDRTTEPDAFTAGIHALMFFTEPPGKGDYYRFNYYKNDSLFTGDIEIFDDEVIDGQTFGTDLPGLDYFGPFDLLEDNGDSAGVEVSSLTKEYFDYLNEIFQQVVQQGSTFDPPPSLLLGNIHQTNNQNNYGFGYFAATAIEIGGITYVQ